MAPSPTRSSTATDVSRKTVPETEYGASAPAHPAVNFFRADFFLRVLLFASSLAALIVLVTSKQTKGIPIPFPPYLMPRNAKFSHSPALIYLVAALAVTCFYSIITLFSSVFAINKSLPSTRLLFRLVLLDALMAGVMASATGAAAAVAYIGLKGNSHTRWNKICNVYDKFCRHIGSSVGVSLFASIVLVALVVLSTYSLYRRSR